MLEGTFCNKQELLMPAFLKILLEEIKLKGSVCLPQNDVGSTKEDDGCKQ
jgi:hypothetical protein